MKTCPYENAYHAGARNLSNSYAVQRDAVNPAPEADLGPKSQISSLKLGDTTSITMTSNSLFYFLVA